jgi:polyhydroxyalkanoate synthase
MCLAVMTSKNADCQPHARQRNEKWLAGAEQQDGSWWPHWSAWLAAQSGEEVPARQPGDGKLKVIEDAPGSYVKVDLRQG